MRKLIVKMAMSVDGFVCGPNHELDWLFRNGDAEAAAWTVTSLWQAGIHIMGSRTFQDMASYWPTSKEIFAPVMNEIPKAVFTSTGKVPTKGTPGLQDATAARATRGEEPLPASADVGNWRSPRVVSGDLAQEIAKMKAEPGKEIVAHGGASFVRSLVKLGLVDEYRFVVSPVVLGRGMSIFAGLEGPLDLQRVSTTAFGSGVMVQIYRPK